MDTQHVRKCLALSTAHVTQNDMHILEANKLMPTSAPYAHGVFVFVANQEADRDEKEACILDLQKTGLSEAFCNVYRLAWKHDVDFILLDRDELEIDGLPTFDW